MFREGSTIDVGDMGLVRTWEPNDPKSENSSINPKIRVLYRNTHKQSHTFLGQEIEE